MLGLKLNNVSKRGHRWALNPDHEAIYYSIKTPLIWFSMHEEDLCIDGGSFISSDVKYNGA